jgi:CheY-like chemotaxis protein
LNLPYLLAESDLKQLLARAKDKARVEGEQKAFDTVAKRPGPDGKGATRPEEPIGRESVGPSEDKPRPEGVAPERQVAPPPITALWVDDRPENNDSVRQVMQQRFGITFENALSTTDAINKLTADRNRYGFLITDVSRPPDRRAGFTLLRQMQSAGIYLPTVIYTGKSVSREFNEEAQRLNAEAITNSPSDLFAVVERLVNRIQMARPGT